MEHDLHRSGDLKRHPAPEGAGQVETSIQKPLEDVIHELVAEFLQSPYAFFTEADAVARFHQLLDLSPSFRDKIATRDGFVTGLVHREYPTFFRFADREPTARLGPPARRGHYDTVILNPDFIVSHLAGSVANREITAPRDTSITPFQAVVEFKLDNRGWTAGRAKGAEAELGKLRLTYEAPLRYFVVLMRYNAPTTARWEKYWPQVVRASAGHPEIGSLFAVSWFGAKEGTETHHFGRWSGRSQDPPRRPASSGV